MPGKKYILTDETKEIAGHILHRIQAVRDFGIVKRGDIGGWIEKEYNLSHEGLCWIEDEVCVYKNAQIYGDAHIFENAKVYGNARIYDNAQVFGDPKIYGFAQVYGDAEICGYGRVYGYARVYGYTLVNGNAAIWSGDIVNTKQYLVIGPIGSRDDCTTFFLADNNIYVTCGCFSGNILEFKQKVNQVHKGSRHKKTI